MTRPQGNAVRRITDRAAAQAAVETMIADMQSWDGFSTDGKIISDRRGAWVKIYVPLADEPDAWTAARLFSKDGEYLCIADFYIGEDTIFVGTLGNEYIVTDEEEMIKR